jgi:hypothetical protein
MNPQQHHQQGAGRQIAVLPEPHQIGALVVSGVKTFVRGNPVIAASYILGWLVLLAARWKWHSTDGAPILRKQSNHEYH